jgi:fatty-acyl-CoA synthase
MDGYVGPGAEDAFVDDGWMHTGDVGYVADGELFITGRSKEVMVQQGKKYHPEDVEWAAARGANVAAAECVAFTPAGADEGEIVVALETSLPEGLDDLEQRVRAAVINGVGITLREVVFVSPDALPKASSGKAQRLAARDQYARGELTPNR